ncbi:hypothetical protein ISS85_04430 [Candidatus Microgenomates bacterium]|nr:hypothetical protein [Candidatus Microgenomates bacterium]
MNEFHEGPPPLIFPEDRDVAPLEETRTDQQSLSVCLRQALETKTTNLPARTETVRVARKNPSGVLTAPEQARLAEAALRGETTMPQFVSKVEEEKRLLDREISQLNTHFIAVANPLILASRHGTKSLFREIDQLFHLLVQEKARTLLPKDIAVADSRIYFHILADHPNGVFLNTFEAESPDEAKEKYLEILGKTVFESNQGEANLYGAGTSAARLEIASQILEGRTETNRDLVLSIGQSVHADFSEDLDKVGPVIKGGKDRDETVWYIDSTKETQT